MASFKSKVENRTQLYYNKFRYKLKITEPNLYSAHHVVNMDEFRLSLKEEVDNTANFPWSIRRSSPDFDEKVISGFISFRIKYKKDDKVTFRKEHNTVSVYSSDLSILNQVYDFKPDATLFEAQVSPAGVKYFTREPPAKYRAYLRNKRVEDTFCEDMIAFLSRNPDVKLSGAFENNMLHQHPYNSRWAFEGYFIDYNDESTLTMLYLMFNGVIGKTYKLEKK